MNGATECDDSDRAGETCDDNDRAGETKLNHGREEWNRPESAKPVYELVNANREAIFCIAAARGAEHVRAIGAVAYPGGRFDEKIDFLVMWGEGTSPLDRESLAAELENLLGRKAGIASHDGSAEGYATAYYRDLVRPRILQTDPVAGTTDSACELHALTCHADWLDLIWSLKSFYHFSNRRYALCIHDDGTIPAEGLGELRRMFPDGRLISRNKSDSKAEIELQEFPRCREFRRKHLLAPKLFDFALFANCEQMLFFDSDLLFFKEPAVLLERIEDPGYRRNTFNGDCQNGYTVCPETVRAKMNLELPPLINSGLGLVQKSSLRIDWCEEFLGLPRVTGGPAWWNEEQTLIALCSSRFGVDLLPEDYRLSLEPGIGDRPFRHYIGQIRQRLMYSEGIHALVDQNFIPWRFVILLESGRLGRAPSSPMEKNNRFGSSPNSSV
jgi:hypothetical protein